MERQGEGIGRVEKKEKIGERTRRRSPVHVGSPIDPRAPLSPPPPPSDFHTPQRAPEATMDLLDFTFFSLEARVSDRKSSIFRSRGKCVLRLFAVGVKSFVNCTRRFKIRRSERVNAH